MTRDEMIKRSFKPYMKLEYNCSILGVVICLLIECDFDNEVFTLRPFDIDKYEIEDFQCSISKVSIPKRQFKLKRVK